MKFRDISTNSCAGAKALFWNDGQRLLDAAMADELTYPSKLNATPLSTGRPWLNRYKGVKAAGVAAAIVDAVARLEGGDARCRRTCSA
jgi:hypothetical protein